MKYKETNFRALYNQFCIFPITDKIKASLEQFEGYEDANILLGYGYIDHEAGLTIEVMCLGVKHGKKLKMFNGNDEITIKLRIGSIEDCDFEIIDRDKDLSIEFKNKLEMLKEGYAENDEIEETRKMEFLDSRRHPLYPDDVMVFMFKEGLEPEGLWAKLCGLGDHVILGNIMNEPDQNFGVHEGDTIAFFVDQNDKGEIGLICDLNPSRKLKAEDLADGTMLKEAISTFNENRNQDNFIEVLELLRDSYVWIPCNAIMSDEDYADIEKIVQENKENLNDLIGKMLSTKGETRMVPDILQNGDAFFFPVFSSCEEMGEYGNNFSKVEKHMLEAIILAKNNEKEVSGIVVNAFTEPFVLDKDLFEPFENSKSRIVEE